ncbi:hypothetical protein N1851_024684 [Merluccius polli]|uniref:Uncharacterized protein n=1 Tax=Merluccius polli TaxID=89951 RepID=A0AA47NVQ5_MERPO|nr:hypothetical protein N1851_024684 [Merluccius polli]
MARREMSAQGDGCWECGCNRHIQHNCPYNFRQARTGNLYNRANARWAGPHVGRTLLPTPACLTTRLFQYLVADPCLPDDPPVPAHVADPCLPDDPPVPAHVADPCLSDYQPVADPCLSDYQPVAEPPPVRLPPLLPTLACPTTRLLPFPPLPDYRLPNLACGYSPCEQ